MTISARMMFIWAIIGIILMSSVSAGLWNASNELQKPVGLVQFWGNPPYSTYIFTLAANNDIADFYLSENGATYPKYFVIDLNQTTALTGVGIKGITSICFGNFSIMYSTDNITWTRWSSWYATASGPPCPGEFGSSNYYKFTNFTVNARYVGFNFTKAQHTGGTNELYIYEVWVTKQALQPMITIASPLNNSINYQTFTNRSMNITWTVADMDATAGVSISVTNTTASYIIARNVTTAMNHYNWSTVGYTGVYNFTFYSNETPSIITYASNITVGFETAGPTCVLINRTPANITQLSTGKFEVLINCTDASGINVTPNGLHLPGFVTRTVEGLKTPGILNYWSIRYPSNNISYADPFGGQGNVLRALGRGEGYWYESLGYNTTLNNETFSYAVNDGSYNRFTMTTTSATSATLNYSFFVEISAFRQSIYLSYEGLVRNPKSNYSIENNNPVLFKQLDYEANRNVSNYTMNVFRNLGHGSTAPTVNMLIYYCNSSYNPGGSTKVIASRNCAFVNTLNSSQVNNINMTDRNSSYSKGTVGVNDRMIANVFATPIYYTYYTTTSPGPRPYYLRYTNGVADDIINTTFANSNVAWTSTNDGTTWTQAAWTPDVITTSSRNYNDSFIMGVSAVDNLGNRMLNLSLFTDDITFVNRPITSPFIHEYNSSAAPYDTLKSGYHMNTMNILIGIAIDSNYPGNVSHNLTLRNVDGSWNYTINSSFFSHDDSDLWINFSTNAVPDGIYHTMVVATSTNVPTDTKSYITVTNFTINNTMPIYPGSPDNNSYHNESLLTVNWTIGIDPLVVPIGDMLGISVMITNSTGQTAYIATDLIGFSPTVLWNTTGHPGYYNFTFTNNMTNYVAKIKDVVVNMISNPYILQYDSPTGPSDMLKSVIHSSTMSVQVGVSKDPNFVGNVSHNLTLRNVDGSWNYTINSSFLSYSDADLWVRFNTKLVPDGSYRTKIVATSTYVSADVQSYNTSEVFVINNTIPIYPTPPTSNNSVRYGSILPVQWIMDFPVWYDITPFVGVSVMITNESGQSSFIGRNITGASNTISWNTLGHYGYYNFTFTSNASDNAAIIRNVSINRNLIVPSSPLSDGAYLPYYTNVSWTDMAGSDSAIGTSVMLTNSSGQTEYILRNITVSPTVYQWDTIWKSGRYNFTFSNNFTLDTANATNVSINEYSITPTNPPSGYPQNGVINVSWNGINEFVGVSFSICNTIGVCTYMARNITIGHYMWDSTVVSGIHNFTFENNFTGATALVQNIYLNMPPPAIVDLQLLPSTPYWKDALSVQVNTTYATLPNINYSFSFYRNGTLMFSGTNYSNFNVDTSYNITLLTNMSSYAFPGDNISVVVTPVSVYATGVPVWSSVLVQSRPMNFSIVSPLVNTINSTPSLTVTINLTGLDNFTTCVLVVNGTGMAFNFTTCYQEDYSDMTACANPSAGTRVNNIFCLNVNLEVDGDWTTFQHGCRNNEYEYINYSIPINVTNVTLLAHTGYDIPLSGNFSVALPSQCFSNPTGKLLFGYKTIASDHIETYCFHSGDLTGGASTLLNMSSPAGTNAFYEEAIIWGFGGNSHDISSGTHSMTFIPPNPGTYNYNVSCGATGGGIVTSSNYNFTYTTNATIFSNPTTTETAIFPQIGDNISFSTTTNTAYPGQINFSSCGLYLNVTGAFGLVDTYYNISGLFPITATTSFIINYSSVASRKVVGWYYNCTDSIGTSTVSTMQTFTVKDIVNPVITANPGTIGNNTVLSALRHNLTMNVTFADLNLFQAAINVSCDVNKSVLYYEVLDINTTTFNYANSLNVSDYLLQNCSLYISAFDDHTANAIGKYNVKNSKDSLTFNTGEGNDITITSPGATSTKSDRLVDRYSYEFAYDDKETADKEFTISSNNLIYYRKDSPYTGHFVVWNPETKRGNWIDFNTGDKTGAKEVVTQSKDGKTWTVSMTNAHPGKNSFFSNPNTFKFNSIGGLNGYNASILFYIGGTINTKMYNLYDNTTYPYYSVFINPINGTAAAPLQNLSVNTWIENLTNGTYDMTFMSSGYFNETYRMVIDSNYSYKTYNTSQGALNVYVRNVKTLLALNESNINISNSLTKRVDRLSSNGDYMMYLHLNSSNYTSNITRPNYISRTYPFTIGPAENKTLVFDMSFIAYINLFDERTLLPFDVSKPNTTEFQIFCANSTHYQRITSSSANVTVDCEYSSFAISLNYGLTAIPYTRPYILTPDEAANMNIYLMDILTTPPVILALSVDDLDMGIYENISIFVKKIMNGSTSQIMASKIGLQNLVIAPLILNDKYQVEIHSTNMPTRYLGDFYAYCVQAGCSMSLRLYDINLFPEPDGFDQTVYQAQAVVNMSGSIIALAQYNDTSGKTIKSTWYVWKDKVNGTLLTSSSIVGNVSSYSYNLSAGGYENNTIFLTLVADRTTDGTWTWNKLGLFSTKNPLDIVRLGYVSQTFINWFFLILMSFIALLFTIKSANIGSIVIIAISALFIYLGWIPIATTLLAIAAAFAIISVIKSKGGSAQ